MAEPHECSNCIRLHNKLTAALSEIRDLEREVIRLRAGNRSRCVTAIASTPVKNEGFRAETNVDRVTPHTATTNGNSAVASSCQDSDTDTNETTNVGVAVGVSEILENLKRKIIQDFVEQWNLTRADLFRELQQYVSVASSVGHNFPVVEGEQENIVEFVRGSGIFMKESQLRECLGQPNQYDVRAQIRNILMALIPEEDLAQMSLTGSRGRNSALKKQKIPDNILHAIIKFFNVRHGMSDKDVMATIKNKLNNLDKKYKRAGGDYRDKIHESEDDSHEAGRDYDSDVVDFTALHFLAEPEPKKRKI